MIRHYVIGVVVDLDLVPGAVEGCLTFEGFKDAATEVKISFQSDVSGKWKRGAV
jgi:hypothetical protein